LGHSLRLGVYNCLAKRRINLMTTASIFIIKSDAKSRMQCESARSQSVPQGLSKNIIPLF
jgi:hypothetical protein